MRIKYLIDPSIVPEDSSSEVLETFVSATKNENLRVSIFPDIHYKKGSLVVNGMLTQSAGSVFPALLGVANCGFSFGVLENAGKLSNDALKKTFRQYSEVLEAYSTEEKYSPNEIKRMLTEYLEVAYAKEDSSLFSFVGIDSFSQLLEEFHRLLSAPILKAACRSLGTLGGGNHFFELHRVVTTYGTSNVAKDDIVYLLHSDSVLVGDMVQLLYSNLHELWKLKGIRGAARRFIWRLRQFSYFGMHTKRLWTDVMGVYRLIVQSAPYRSLDASSNVTRDLLLTFYFAAIFGEMNRDIILRRYLDIAAKSYSDLSLSSMGTHSHDSITVEKYNGQEYVVQRNGVQYLGEDPIFVLPGALGTESYLMHNPRNKESLYSANHGVGRILDKHLAKKKFKAPTSTQLEDFGMSVYRVGAGNLEEQHSKAFKNISTVVDMMEKYDLGTRAAELHPIVSLKG